MSEENKTGLVGIQGNKVVPIEKAPKKPQERLYRFVMVPVEAGKEPDEFTSYGVLVVTPGFVGIGDPDNTEIRAAVPFEKLFYVTAAQSVGSAAQGSA